MAIGDTVQAGLMRVDFSPFLEAGRANAAANASFGQALGQVAKGFIEGQQKKKRASEIAGFLMGQGVGEKDAMAIAKNPFLQKEYQRKQEAEAKMKMEKERLATQSNIAAQGRAARQAEIDQKNERADAETQRLINFSENLISETTDPAVQQNADMARPGLFALGGDTEMRNRFLDAEIERQPKTTVGNLGAEDFATVARETGMDPRLSANRFMSLQAGEAKQAQEELASQPKLGDTFASRIGALSPYYFSESDARNAVTDEATKLGINLNKDQLAQAVSKQKIIPTKDLRSTADTRFSKLNLDEPRTILEAADDLEAFLNEGGVLSGKVAKEKLARMVQPAGILTEDDLRRMGTSSAFMDSLNTLLEEKKTGKIDKTLEGYLRDTTKVFKKRAQQVLQEKTDYVVNSLANNFGITPEEVRNYTQFGNIMYGLDNDQKPTDLQNTSPQITAPQSVNLNSGGIFTPVQ